MLKLFIAFVNVALREKVHEEISVVLRNTFFSVCVGILSVCFKVRMFGMVVAGVYS